MIISMDRFDNTSSALIPISSVDKYGDANQNERIQILCCGLGVGFFWATVAFELDDADILPLVHTEEYFKDGYNLDDQV